MNDTVEIKYKGQFEPLKNLRIKISPELVRDGRVDVMAQNVIGDAICELPGFESLELPLDLWNTIQYGDRIFLLHWEVDMKPY